MTALHALLLNGSPNPRGHTMRLAEAMLEVFAAAGAVVHTEHLYELDIFPCRACGACADFRESGTDKGDCRLADAVPGLLRRLAEANLLLVASPLHFTSLSAPVIAFFSRLQPFWLAEKKGVRALPERPRQAALVLTAGSEYPEMFRPARSVAAAAFKTLGIPFAGIATAAGTDRLPATENRAELAEAEALAKRMLRAVTS